MKKIIAVFASVIAAGAMSVCAFAEAPANGAQVPENDVLLIAAAPDAADPNAPIVPDDTAPAGNTDSNKNANTGAEGIALGAAAVISCAVMAASAKRR